MMESDHQTASPIQQIQESLARQIHTQAEPQAQPKPNLTSVSPLLEGLEPTSVHQAPISDSLPSSSRSTTKQTSVSSPAPLTKTNLKQLLRETDETIASRSSISTMNSEDSKDSVTTTTGEKLQSQLIRNGCIHVNDDPMEPVDSASLFERLDKDRASPPPSPSAFKTYKKQSQYRHLEAKTQARLWTDLAQKSSRPDVGADIYTDYFNTPMCHLDNQVTNNITVAKPDVVEALRITTYPTAIVDAIPELSPGQYDFAMPSFAAEFKRRSVALTGAQLQCAYDGSLMVHAAMQAHKHMYGSLDDFYGKTAALTLAFSGEHLEFYLHHATLNEDQDDTSPDRPPVLFHQHRVHVENVIVNYPSFKSAWTHIRNAQDIGHEMATDLRQQLKVHYTKVNAAIKKAAEAEVAAEAADALATPAMAGDPAIYEPWSPASVPSNADKNPRIRPGPQLEALDKKKARMGV